MAATRRQWRLCPSVAGTGQTATWREPRGFFLWFLLIIRLYLCFVHSNLVYRVSTYYLRMYAMYTNGMAFAVLHPITYNMHNINYTSHLGSYHYIGTYIGSYVDWLLHSIHTYVVGICTLSGGRRMVVELIMVLQRLVNVSHHHHLLIFGLYNRQKTLLNWLCAKLNRYQHFENISNSLSEQLNNIETFVG